MPFQNFHNLIVKMNLIKEVSPKEGGGKLLDLACGKGGDLSKWTNAKYKEVVSIDIDKKCIEYAEKYYLDYKNVNKPEVEFVWGDTSKLIFPSYKVAMNEDNKLKIKRLIPSKYKFDVVSSQFCLHYYFEDEIKLRTLLQNINDNLKIGGYFIGTCFDGERVMEALKKKTLIEGKTDNDKVLWKIEKMYKGTSKSPYGKEINVYVSSIDNEHKEYLVNFKFLDDIMEEYGMDKVKVIEFADIYEQMEKGSNVGKSSIMSEVEKDFSFLNNMFIYRKQENTPDMIYKKLQKMVEKEEKKEENNSGVKKIRH